MNYEHGEPGAVLSLHAESLVWARLDATLGRVAEAFAAEQCGGDIHEAWLAIYSTAEKHATLAEQCGYGEG